jgi:hypothetical protein
MTKSATTTTTTTTTTRRWLIVQIFHIYIYIWMLIYIYIYMYVNNTVRDRILFNNIMEGVPPPEPTRAGMMTWSFNNFSFIIKNYFFYIDITISMMYMLIVDVYIQQTLCFPRSIEDGLEPGSESPPPPSSSLKKYNNGYNIIILCW